MTDIDPSIMCDPNKLTDSQGAEVWIDGEWMSMTDPKEFTKTRYIELTDRQLLNDSNWSKLSD